jgi:SAM-dependent methyltransferase
MPERYSDYDDFAWFYNRHWGHDFHRRVLGVLDRLLFPRLAAGSRVLDLCCGDGHFTQALVERGFRVTGIDASERMLGHARENAPGCKYILADAREFHLAPEFSAAVSVFDSLNHMMSIEDLGRVFRNVRAALREGGWFVFDLNQEAAYTDFSAGPFTIVEDDNVCISTGSYDRASRLVRCDLVMFRFQGGWRRTDLTLFQRCYDEREVAAALTAEDFTRVDLYSSEDLGLTTDDVSARVFFLAQA